MNLPDDQSLRPEFTASLAKSLRHGASINLISPHGQGRRRTLLDLRQYLPESLRIFQVNMRDYQTDYKGFYETLCAQVNSLNRIPDQLNDLLDLIEQKAAPTLFILHNFDEIKNGNINNYNRAFIQALNSISHRKNIGLLCVCEKYCSDYLLKPDGSPLSDSNLAAKSEALPPITQKQLVAELQRRMLADSEDELAQISDWLLTQPAPYSSLEDM